MTVSRSLCVLWIATGLAAASALVLSGSRAHSARTRADAELAALRSTAEQARELLRLRHLSSSSPLAATDEPTPALAPRLSDTLAAAGVTPTALAGVTPQDGPATGRSAAGGGVRVRHRRAGVSLSGLTLPQVGRVLELWRKSEPSWTVSSIDLRPTAQAGNTASAGGDLPLEVALVMESLGLEKHGGVR